MANRPVTFAAVGLAHPHSDLLTAMLLQEGAVLAAVVEDDAACRARHEAATTSAPRRELTEVLEDDAIDLVLTAAVPNERAIIAAAALRHGKHVLADKPCCLTDDELRDVRAAQQSSGRGFAVWYGERVYNPAALLAVDLVRDGVIGDLLHFVGLGPHQLNLMPRPSWFYDRRLAGGILPDLACHQIDMFLACSGNDSATVTAARAVNRHHRDRPNFEDLGDLVLESAGGVRGYARVDWHSPDGLGTWGDGRTFLVGSKGTLELRRTIDPAADGQGAYVILVDANGPRRLDVAARPVTFVGDVVADVRDHTETAMTSAHAFAVIELALTADAMARQQPAIGFGPTFRREAIGERSHV
ncbi:MAG: Gfo/Idh/MocA family oxidoreductase [Actinobacteria bacterium]|nr:Gfo/Idh/MocA family oxidoreductase [Actinomycetota bacterium]